MSVPQRSLFALLVSVAIVAGCGTAPERPPAAALPRDIMAFSQSPAGSNLPDVWQPWRLSRFKSPSSYQLIEDSGRTVILASAQASAPGLIHYLDVDPRERPMLSWRRKVTDLSPTKSSADDSPARIVVSFDGDHEKLDFGDRLFYSQFRLFTGQQLPYAS